MSPKGLSRWKGMETFVHKDNPYTLPLRPKGLSRWKGMETFIPWLYFFLLPCPKGLSRWKGMETYSKRCTTRVGACVRKDFPGGREWKPSSVLLSMACCPNNVRKDFPGGREWKLCYINTILFHSSGLVRKDFPGGREWKLNLLLWVKYSSRVSPKGLSRWKGMETRVCCPSRKSYFVTSERTFPVEGNGNRVKLVSEEYNQPSERTFPVEGNGNVGASGTSLVW